MTVHRHILEERHRLRRQGEAVRTLVEERQAVDMLVRSVLEQQVPQQRVPERSVPQQQQQLQEQEPQEQEPLRVRRLLLLGLVLQQRALGRALGQLARGLR